MARAHGTGTLIKRGNVYTARWMVKGKVYTRSTGCTNERDARKKLEEFTKPFRENSNIEVLENLEAKVRASESQMKKTKNDSEPPMQLKFIVDEYKKDISTSNITESSERIYNSMVNTLVEFTQKKFVHEITKEDALKFMEKIKSKNGAGTFNHYINILRKLFSIAMKHDYRIRMNPFDGFNKLKGNGDSGRRELTDDEVKKLCEIANKSNRVGGELGLLFEIAIYTGLRYSDCRLLKWSSVDLGAKLIKVLPMKTKKNGREARIPIHPKLLAKLSGLKHDDSGYVLPTIAKNDRACQLAIDKVFEEANIITSEKGKDGKLRIVTGFHAFRHYFISQCVKNGIPISVVQAMVAHSSADMSLAYTHTFDSDLQLPDYDGDTTKITLKKSTVEALNKAKGVHDLDDFLMSLLKGTPTTIAHEKTKSEIELDEALDEMFADK